jgi:hypothetical protein
LLCRFVPPTDSLAGPFQEIGVVMAIEVISAIMVTGTVGDAARLLNVSSPGKT